jgi:uncharacterized protein (DUF2461 family)
MTDTFKGFPKDFFAFLCELKYNNNRGWFEANKQRFRDSVQVPMSAFCRSDGTESRENLEELHCRSGAQWRLDAPHLPRRAIF